MFDLDSLEDLGFSEGLEFLACLCEADEDGWVVDRLYGRDQHFSWKGKVMFIL